MATGLKALLNPEALAVAKARFHAWWEGEAFDEAAVKAALAKPPEGEAEAAPAGAFAEEPEPPLEPRLMALETLWGADRLAPGDAMDEKLHPARMGLSATGLLAVMGPGLAAPIAAVAEAHPGALLALEWREEALAVLPARLRRAKLAGRCETAKLDLDLYSAQAEAWDGLLSLDEFTYAPNPSRLAVQIAKGLKPGSTAIIETYLVEARLAATSAFAAAFAEPHLMSAGDLRETLKGAGLVIEDEDDLTAAHLETAKEGFRRLEDALLRAAKGGMAPGVGREIAWEAESWAVRMSALSSARLTRRRFIARRLD